MLLTRTLLSHYRRHPLQGLFLLVGITLANALLVGTLMINAQARASYDDGRAWLNTRPLAVIAAADGARYLPETAFLQLRRQGFSQLVPVLETQLLSKDVGYLNVLGIDPFSLPQGSGSSGDTAGVDWSGFVRAPFQLLVAPARLRQLDWPAGSTPLLANGRTLPPLRPLDDAALGYRLLLDLGQLQELSGQRGLLSQIMVLGDDESVLAALRQALPADLVLQTTADAPDPARLTRSFHLNLSAMGLLAFVVGLFLCFNAIAFSYTERRELFRRLRLAGVSRRQGRNALLLELLLLSLLGLLLGYLLGLLLARQLLPGVGLTLAQLYDVHIRYPDRLFGRGWALPLVMTLLSLGLCALGPLRGLLTTPLLGRQQDRWNTQRLKHRDRWLLLAGTVGLLGSLLLAWLALNWWPSLFLALAAMALMLLGTALCLPQLFRSLLNLLALIVRPPQALLGWSIADTRWLLGPAAIALMALALALVANSGLNTMIGSFRGATADWLDQRLAARLYLSLPSQEDSGSGPVLQAATLQQWLGQQHADLQLQQRYSTRTELQPPAGQPVPVEVSSLPLQKDYLSGLQLLSGNAGALEAFAASQGVLISERAARLDGWSTGDTVQPCTDGRGLAVLGVYRDYGNPLSQVLLAEPLFKDCQPSVTASGYGVTGTPALDWKRLQQDLVARFGLTERQWIDQQSLKQEALAVFDRTFVVTRALNALTLLVAGVGIFCAISAIDHHRQARQALLASLGVSRRQRGWLLLGQWGLLTLVMLILVWPFGLLLAWLLGGVVTPVAFGWSFALRPDWRHLPDLILVTLASLSLALAWPSLRLLRVSPGSLLREQTP